MITNTRILVTDELNPHNNLALEDLLLQQLPEGQATLFLWQNQHTVVIGAGQNAWRECHTQLLREEGGTLARRSSGGGAVYHDLGNLNFSFLVPRADYDVSRQLDVVLRAVQRLGIDAKKSGRNDLTTVDGRKFSGNAFRLLKGSALHHGTLLIHVDMQKLGRYLNVDKQKLESKGVKSVPSRVVNLGELREIAIADARRAMIEAFSEEYGAAPVERAEDLLLDSMAQVQQKYQSWEWNYGASPAGAMNLMKRFDWGAVEIDFSLLGGKMRDVQVFTDAMDETLHLQLMQALEGAPFEGAELERRIAPLNLPDLARFLRESEQ